MSRFRASSQGRHVSPPACVSRASASSFAPSSLTPFASSAAVDAPAKMRSPSRDSIGGASGATRPSHPGSNLLSPKKSHDSVVLPSPLTETASTGADATIPSNASSYGAVPTTSTSVHFRPTRLLRWNNDRRSYRSNSSSKPRGADLRLRQNSASAPGSSAFASAFTTSVLFIGLFFSFSICGSVASSLSKSLSGTDVYSPAPLVLPSIVAIERRLTAEPIIAFETHIYSRLGDFVEAATNPRTLTRISASTIESKPDAETKFLFRMKNRSRVPAQILVKQIDRLSCSLVVVGPIVLKTEEQNERIPILVEAVSERNPSTNALFKVVLILDENQRRSLNAHSTSSSNVVDSASRHVIKRRQADETIAFVTKVYGRESDFVDADKKHRLVTELKAAMIQSDGFPSGTDAKLLFKFKNRDDVPPQFKLKLGESQACKIIVVAPIDRDRLDEKKYPDGEVTILVEATPENQPDVSATLKVIYVIEDSNDEMPIFETGSLSGELNENSDPASVNPVVKVKAVDADSDVDGNGKVTYSSAGMKKVLPNGTEEDVPDPGSYFTLNSVNGDIEVKRKIDRESVSKFIMTVVASDNPIQGKPFTATGNVTIVIKDVNDNPPKCVPKEILCKVLEDVEIGSKIPACHVTCEDKDESQSDSNEFTTKSLGGSSCPLEVLSGGDVKLVQKLDREVDKRHKCIVEIVDQGKPDFKDDAEIVLEVLDVNDTPPRFLNTDLLLKVPIDNNTANFTIPEVITIIDEDEGSESDVITVELLGGSENFTLLRAEPDDTESGMTNTSLPASAARHFNVRLNRKLDAGDAGFLPLHLRICDSPSSGANCREKRLQVLVDAPEAGRREASVNVGALAAVTLIIILGILLILVFILFTRMREKQKKKDAIYSIDDEASDIIKYDEEGPGEEDTDAYDPRLLQKPVNGLGGTMNAGMNGGLNGHGPPLDDSLQQTYAPTKRISPPPPPTVLDFPVEDFINDRLQDAEKDDLAPPDEILPFEFEGGGSVAGSLSSLNSSDGREGEQDQDFTNLYNWGPQFAKLADMYGGGAEPEDD